MDFGRMLKGELLMQQKTDAFVPYAQPLVDAVDLFESLGIGYALIGGIASMYYGRSRFTEDVDFVADAGHMDLLAANPAAMEQHHFEPTCTHKLYHKSGVQVDIWKDEHAGEIISRARQVQLAGRSIHLIDPHDLAAMKLRAQRPKDDYDISEIAATGIIDEAVLKSLVTAEEMLRYAAITARAR
jgi:hypothetical protein